MAECEHCGGWFDGRSRKSKTSHARSRRCRFARDLNAAARAGDAPLSSGDLPAQARARGMQPRFLQRTREDGAVEVGTWHATQLLARDELESLLQDLLEEGLAEDAPAVRFVRATLEAVDHARDAEPFTRAFTRLARGRGLRVAPDERDWQLDDAWKLKPRARLNPLYRAGQRLRVTTWTGPGQTMTVTAVSGDAIRAMGPVPGVDAVFDGMTRIGDQLAAMGDRLAAAGDRVAARVATIGEQLAALGDAPDPAVTIAPPPTRKTRRR